MRHGTKFNHLGRKSAHRKMLLSNLACELFTHKRIVTTLAKARALRVYAEPLLTKAKSNTTHQRRIVFGYLQDKTVITELFGPISEKIAARPGGYTRIIKLGKRLGDAAEMALIELVDYNELYTRETPGAKGGAKKSRRRGGGGRKKAAEAETPAPEAAATEAAAPEAEAAAPETAAPETEEKPEAAPEDKKNAEGEQAD
ncbi:50S ribosomal protein L17 [Compostibacter hankyongensis]|uniref:Large ribosomal subunit protein bL17 n=1 Tax=Compostibacter hankyongensis TaxID=1007089 RepID=A0ABP8GAP1_9BACT